MDDIVSKALAMTGSAPAPRPEAPRFAIQSQQFRPTGKAGTFKSYDEAPTMKDLKSAFDTAISNHLSLSPADQVQNVIAADRRLSPHTGALSNGRGVPLLGKNAKLLKSETGYGSRRLALHWHRPTKRASSRHARTVHPARMNALARHLAITSRSAAGKT
jgi:hypothetical protein